MAIRAAGTWVPGRPSDWLSEIIFAKGEAQGTSLLFLRSDKWLLRSTDSGSSNFGFVTADFRV